MKSPQIPDNEAQRISTLKSYQILDTPPESGFDDLTELASFICGTPIALLSLTDSDRQFFKSKKGLSVMEIPRKMAFCAHAINTPNEPMIIPDASKDERFSDNPLVSGAPQIAFYAGIPLVTKDGFALGTLCVLNSKPQKISLSQVDALKKLANQAVSLLELRRKNQLLEESEKQLCSLAKEMETFAYTASHDLKEPLRMVKSFVKLLEQNYSQKLDDKAVQYIAYTVDGVLRMETLIDTLLEYSRAGSLNDEAEEIDVKLLLQEVLQLQGLAIKENKVKLEIGDLPKITGYETGIKQVFTNILSNAIKYQKKDSCPVIHISAQETHSHWKFAISDNGIGIPAAFHETIFIIFKRLHRKEDYAGTGIGLAICKKVIEQHKGTIWVESDEGMGSTFYFTIAKHLN